MEMTFSGPIVFGMHLEIFLMIVSGVFYLLCAILLWKPLKAENSELIRALFAFLVYQAISMFFMGIEMYTHNIAYSNIAALAIFVGSAYMLKFVYGSLSRGTRKVLFLISLIIVIGVFAWFMQTEQRQMDLMHFVLWYDIAVNGIIVGGAIIIFGLMAVDKWSKAKALGGGTGVVSCCVVANATMLGGAFLVSSVFQFLAPIIILGSLVVARNKRKE